MAIMRLTIDVRSFEKRDSLQLVQCSTDIADFMLWDIASSTCDHTEEAPIPLT
jgi:hypothetical protein